VGVNFFSLGRRLGAGAFGGAHPEANPDRARLARQKRHSSMHRSVALRIAKVSAALALVVPMALTARTPCRFAVSHQQMVAGTSTLDQAYRWFVSVLPWSIPGTEPRPLQHDPAHAVKPLTTCTIDPSGGCVSSNTPATQSVQRRAMRPITDAAGLIHRGGKTG
jgi:hypothetical protein